MRSSIIEAAAGAAICWIGAFRPPEIMAVHRRILFDGDHELFERGGAVMGLRWREVHQIASG